MALRDAFEFAIWVGLITTRATARVVQVAFEWLFVMATWIALIAIGVVMAFQRSGLPWSDPSDSRATSRSPGSTARRGPHR
jgi:hypothetical protein